MFDILNNIFDLASKKNIKEIFLVGGFIRDYLISNEISQDIDFALFVNDGETEIFARDVAKKIKGAFIVLDEKEQSYRVVKDAISLDFTKNRGKNLTADLLARDFTINAFAMKLTRDFDIRDLKKCEIIDKTNGFNDLENKIVRVISEKSFLDDPLRLLRTFRISAKYQFNIDDLTLKLIKKHAKLISKSAKERIHEELMKFFSYSDIFEYLVKMDETKLLENIFEAVNFMKSHNDYYFHKLGLWGHSLEVLFCFEFLLKNLDKLFSEEKLKLFSDIKDDFGMLKIATLFHDIGKPHTFSFENNKVHFINHDVVGAEKIEQMLRKLKFSKKEIKLISNMAFFHMQTGNLVKEENISEKACFRFFKRTDKFALHLFLFTLSDWLASIRGVKNIDYSKNILVAEFEYPDFIHCLKSIDLMLDWYLQKLNKKTIKKILNGNDIMQKFPSIKPSKFLGEILLKVEEAQILGEIKSKKSAFKFVEKIIENTKK